MAELGEVVGVFIMTQLSTRKPLNSVVAASAEANHQQQK
jgi:hypothetical protein